MKRVGKIPQIELSKLVGVSVLTLRNWAEGGLDLDDMEAVKARAAKVHERADASEDSVAAKLRKIRAEANILEHKLAVQQGDFVSAEEVKNEGLRMGTAVKSVFLRMPDDLPPLLAGRTAAEVKVAVWKYVRDKLTELSTYRSPIRFDGVDESPVKKPVRKRKPK